MNIIKYILNLKDEKTWKLFLFRNTIQCLLLFNITLEVLIMQGKEREKKEEREGKREVGIGGRRKKEEYWKLHTNL